MKTNKIETAKNQMKAVILARVSTEEQKETGNSLSAQVDRLHDYVKGKPELKFDCEYIFDESTCKDTRKKFDKVIEYLVTQKETIALCCDKVDRLSRDFSVGLLAIENLRREGKIELHFPSDNLILSKNSPATDLFHFNIAVSLAQYYSNAISNSVKRSLKQKRQNGEWYGKAPIGYKYVVDSKKNKTLVPEQKTGNAVKRIFYLCSKGKNISSICKIVRLNNNTVSSGTIGKILKNPFYIGTAVSKHGLYPHKYQPIVSKEVFDKCQAPKKGVPSYRCNVK